MIEASDVVRVMETPAAAGVRAWLDGGWAVDAAVGRVTRPHDDLDLTVDRDDLTRLDQVLSAGGWTARPSRPPGRPTATPPSCWVLTGNTRARAMYERRGWRPDGTLQESHGQSEIGLRLAL